MKIFGIIFRRAVPAFCAAGLLASQATAMPPVAPQAMLAGSQMTDAVVNVASDCYAVGQQVAAKNGGTLAKASPATRGGAPVCVIVVLVPGKDGERPRRTEIVVPQ